jgi:multidrug efflux pump subunit AcrA (membrane-fusion protein)
MTATLLLYLAAFAQVSPGANPPEPFRPVSASIRPINDPHVFAQTEGLITGLKVKQGDSVKKGAVLALIDDKRAKAGLDVATYAFVAADERAKDTIEYEYAVLSAAVAQKAWESALDARSRVATAISDIELEKLKLEYDRGVLQGDKAQKDQRLARLDADVKQAELRAAKDELERRTLIAPFDGEIQELLLEESEWVNPGDPILQLVHFETMWVETMIDAAKYDPAELQHRPATVLVSLARGRQAKVSGKVVFVSQSLLESPNPDVYGPQYLVRVEIQNVREAGFWLVRPGMPAMLTIHVDQDPIAADPAPSQSAAGN